MQRLALGLLACSVELEALSYDSPGVDSEEFVALRISAPSTTLSVDAGPTTLADCGIDRLELFNGGAVGCPLYQTLPLGHLSLPEAGLLQICSPAASSLRNCQVTQDADGPLPDGWIQNGPADGLRLIDVSDRILFQYSYEGLDPVCFPEATATLPTQAGTGQIVRCEGVFTLLDVGEPCPSVAPNPENPSSGATSAPASAPVATPSAGAGATPASNAAPAPTQSFEPLSVGNARVTASATESTDWAPVPTAPTDASLELVLEAPSGSMASATPSGRSFATSDLPSRGCALQPRSAPVGWPRWVSLGLVLLLSRPRRKLGQS